MLGSIPLGLHPCIDDVVQDCSISIGDWLSLLEIVLHYAIDILCIKWYFSNTFVTIIINFLLNFHSIILGYYLPMH